MLVQFIAIKKEGGILVAAKKVSKKKPVDDAKKPETQEVQESSNLDDKFQKTKKLLDSFAKEEKPKEEEHTVKSELRVDERPSEGLKIVDKYEFKSRDIPITIVVLKKKGEFVPIYEVSISSISRTTEFILEKIRQELIKRVNFGMIDIVDTKKTKIIEEKFQDAISVLIDKYFPDVDTSTKGFLNSYLISKSLGLGNIELLMADAQLEEIVINQSGEPVWVYHVKHGWLKTNIFLRDEEQIIHYAGMIGRKVGRQISVLDPLLDAHLTAGDRVNATLYPISTKGNTVTIRKFSRDPWTITRFLNARTISLDAAALVWLCIHYEMSAIIAGGTASGKTSTLNALANFFPPNQRIVSIEDTRELRLPKYLHWVPLNTRLPNAEGRGEVSMGDLLVNSLRMRPDRILVGEVRRKKEAETLFEAIHTGHSVYATFHANNAEETVERLTNPPIDVPKIMLPAISLLLIQFRNRRTGVRRSFQLAEVLPDSKPNVLMQYDPRRDTLANKSKSKSLMSTLSLYTGYSANEIRKQILEKIKVLKYLSKMNYVAVDDVGRVIAEYYTDLPNLMRFVNKNKKFI